MNTVEELYKAADEATANVTATFAPLIRELEARHKEEREALEVQYGDALDAVADEFEPQIAAAKLAAGEAV